MSENSNSLGYLTHFGNLIWNLGPNSNVVYWIDEPQGPAEGPLGRKRKAHQPSIFDSQAIFNSQAKIGAKKKREAECDSIAKTPRGRGGK